MCTVFGPSSLRLYLHIGPSSLIWSPIKASWQINVSGWNVQIFKFVFVIKMLLCIREQVMLWRVYFEIFHGTFLLFHIHIEQFSVISVRRFILLLLLRRLIPICPRNWYRMPATKPLAPISTALTVTLYSSFSSSFLRSSDKYFSFEGYIYTSRQKYLATFNFFLFLILNVYILM